MSFSVPKGSTTSSIGLDIGSSTIKAVQVRRRSDMPEISAAIEFERSGSGAYPDQDETQRIEGVLFRRGFTGSRITIAVPREGEFYEEVDRPPRGRAVPEDQIIHGEVARARRIEPETFEQAWWDVPNEVRRGSAGTAMVIGCERDPLLEAVERFEHIGLEIVAVDGGMTALARSVADAGLEGDPFTVIIDLGWDAASIAVIYSGVVVYRRESEACGGRALLGRVAERLGIDPDIAAHLLASSTGAHEGAHATLADHARRVCEDLEVSLSYASHRFRKRGMGRVLLCGGGAELGVVRDRIDMTDGCEARVLRPGDFARFPGERIRDLNSDRPSLTLATALATRFDRG